jgi:hypothetical protein
VYAAPMAPILGSLTEYLLIQFGPAADTIFCPDISVPAGKSLQNACFVAECMPYGRFQALLRQIAGPMCNDVHLSTYSLRRMLPSVADALNLAMPERSALGNWVDSSDQTSSKSEPMAVRYSAARLTSSAAVRRLCLAALYHATTVQPDVTLADMEHLRGRVEDLRSLAGGSHWFHITLQAKDRMQSQLAEAPVGLRQSAKGPEAPSDADVSLSGTESSGSESSSDESLAPTDLETLRWLCPAKGRLHIAMDQTGEEDDKQLIPLCSNGPLAWNGAETGEGIQAALAHPKPWCTKCLKKAGPIMSALIHAAAMGEATASPDNTARHQSGPCCMALVIFLLALLILLSAGRCLLLRRAAAAQRSKQATEAWSRLVRKLNFIRRRQRHWGVLGGWLRGLPDSLRSRLLSCMPKDA